MMEILTCEQGSQAWFDARLGSIGGSSISSVVAGGQGKMRKSLMYRLAGEILSGVKYESYSNAHMERGTEQEADARIEYQMTMNNRVDQVGLIKAGEHKHESPDGLVDPIGKIEIKCVIPSVQVETILSDRVPAAYRKQCQWGLFICEREWCDFVSYSPLVVDRPIWIKRVSRDEKLITELDEGADKFIEEMLAIVEKIKGG
jgi:putative phage-type endonuclease